MLPGFAVLSPIKIILTGCLGECMDFSVARIDIVLNPNREEFVLASSSH